MLCSGVDPVELAPRMVYHDLRVGVGLQDELCQPSARMVNCDVNRGTVFGQEGRRVDAALDGERRGHAVLHAALYFGGGHHPIGSRPTFTAPIEGPGKTDVGETTDTL